MDVGYSGFDLPIRFTYRPPVWLLPLMVFCYCGGSICVIYTSLPAIIKSTLLVVASIKFASWFRKDLQNRKITTVIILNKKDQWYVIHPELHPERPRLVSASILLPDLIFLRLENPDKRHYDLILTGACLDKETLRRLRVRLKFPRTEDTV